MIEIFCGIPLSESYKLKMSSVVSIVDILERYVISYSLHHTEQFTMNGEKFGFIPDLEEISLGEYIDLDGSVSDWSKMHIAMNVLYRPIKDSKAKRYNIIPYDVSNPNRMKDMPLGCAISSLFFFYNLGKELSNGYDTLFTGTTAERGYTKADIFNSKWGWYSSIYALANGDITRFEDITKLNVNQSFTMLSFMKEKTEIEQQQIKSKF